MSAAQVALEALKNYTTASGGFCVCCGGEAVCKKDCEITSAIAALEAEIAQVEPVGWMAPHGVGFQWHWGAKKPDYAHLWEPLYTRPAAHQAVNAELLKTLKEFIDAFDGVIAQGGSSVTIDDQSSGWVSRARAAIQKAEGAKP